MKQYIPLGNVISKASVERCGTAQLPILSITMKDGLVLQDEKFKKRIASADTSEYKVIPRGKLVQGIHIDEANFGIQDVVEKGIVSPAYKVWDVDDTIIYPKYLETVLRSPRSIAFYRSKLNGSVNRRGRMTDDDFLGMLIPFADYSTQIRAIDFLGRVKSIIGKQEQQLFALDNLIKSRFVEMFGDPICNPMNWNTYLLEDCLAQIDSGKSFVCSDRPRTGNRPAVLKLSAATYGDYRPSENKALLDDDLFIEGAEVHSGDLLFTRKNTPELVGMAAYVQDTPPKLMMPDLIFRLVPNERMNAVFLWQLINCREFRPVIQGISGGSAKSMSNISKERLGKIKVICPPRILQDELIPFIAQVTKSKSAIQKSLDETQLLFDSLMQEYFG
jgi:type I restriction enzyme S subunit